MSLYALRAIPAGGFAMAKFDLDLNPEACYEVTNATCTCPAGKRPTCKHRGRLLAAFLKRGHIADGWFLNDATMFWHRPVADLAEPVTGVSATSKPELDLSQFVRRT